MRTGCVSYRDLYAAQWPIFGPQGQMRLRRTRVHVCGAGGIGSQVLLNLAAAGFGHLTANDPQALEPDNFNRFPTAGPEDIGIPKVALLSSLLADRRFLRFRGIFAANEDSATNPLYERANYIVCCSNTPQSRITAARKALSFRKPLLDIAVADCRKSFAVVMKIWLPENDQWSACPACYLHDDRQWRSAALANPIITVAAGTASLSLLQLAAGLKCSRLRTHNCFGLDIGSWEMQGVAVERNISCNVCAISAE